MKEGRSQRLSFTEGVAMLVGTNIGIGILSIAHVSKNAGFLPLLFWLVIAGILSTITMLYIAEATLRTKAHLQLTGLCVKYIGPWSTIFMFVSVAVTALGALTAYENASGQLIGGFLRDWGIIDEGYEWGNKLGSLIFFVPAAGVLWLGLRAIGKGEKQIVGIMFVILVVLIIATFFKTTINFSHALEMHWSASAVLPIFNTVVFIFSSQYIVPEMARGYTHKPEMLPKAIILGNVITFSMLALVPLSAIVIDGLENISGVVTQSWGRAIGDWAYTVANLFALFAILTSYWGLGGMFITNIADQIKRDASNNMLNRFVILLFVVIPPLALVIFDLVKTIDEALYWPGVVGALVLSFAPILILQNSRKMGDREALWACPSFITSIGVKLILIFVYFFATIYGIAVKYGLVSKILGVA